MLKVKIVLLVTSLLLVTIQNSCAADITPTKMSRDSYTQGIYFPAPGQSVDAQDQRSPKKVGLDPELVNELRGKASRWALWRHGYLVHVEGDFNQKTEVASLRKTWHALTVGAAIKQGKIPSYHQKLSKWNKELTGNDAEATWWHVITQSTAFNYPYNDYPDYKPGKMWTYSDHNPYHLCHALAKAYGKKNYYDNYSDVVAQAYFNDIGMRGWSTSTRQDGIRFHFDLEDMGRLGLLVLTRGKWKDKEVIPQWFVEELETKQTYGMLVNYDGPYDGKIGLDPVVYPECPYGYMTWVNTDQDLYPGADAAWANGAGAGGTYILWNHRNGIVFAGVAVKTGPTSNGIPHIIERNITGPNPLIAEEQGEKLDEAYLESLRTEVHPKSHPKVSKGVLFQPKIIIGKAGERNLTGDVFTPKKIPSKTRPAIVFLHGGSWMFGSPSQFHHHADYLARKYGFFALSVDYRLSDETKFPAALQDAKCAIRWIRSHAKKLNIDLERIAICGGSAGAHLSSMVATTAGVKGYEGNGGHQEFPSHVNAVILFNGEFDMWDLVKKKSLIEAMIQFIGDSAEEMPEKYDELSSVKRIHSQVPATLLLHGTIDKCVSHEQSVAFFNRLQEVGVHAELELYQDKPHAWFNREPDRTKTLKRIERFLVSHFELGRSGKQENKRMKSDQ